MVLEVCHPASMLIVVKCCCHYQLLPQQMQARRLNPIPKQPATGGAGESKCLGLVCWNAISCFTASQGETRNNHLLVSQLHSHFFLGLKQLHSKRSPQRTSIAFLGPKFDENSNLYACCHLKDYHLQTNLDWYSLSFSMFCTEFWLTLLSKNIIPRSTYLTAGVRIHLQLAAKEAASFSMFSW